MANYEPHKLIGTIFTFILLYNTACKALIQERTVNAISIGIEVGTGYHYSSEAELKLKNSIFSLRYKAEYDHEGNVVMLTIYRPEGILEYQKQDLLQDPALLKSINLPFTQHLKYLSNQGLFNNSELVPASMLNDSVLISTQGTLNMFFNLD
jgi:hypothetical protein